jgi:hypothetical protein
MSGKMIENSDRGITLNKSLAWTISVTFLAGAFWVGVQVTNATNGIETLGVSLKDMRSDATMRQEVERQRSIEVDARLRALETTRAADANEISALRRDLTDFRSELREAVSVLRSLGQ